MNVHTQHGSGLSGARRSFARHTFPFLNRALLACAVVVGLRLGAAAAEVSTDQADYAPGMTALITGNGFAPGESVVLQVAHNDGTPDNGADHQPWTMEADAS